jgi:hypothetical protein
LLLTALLWLVLLLPGHALARRLWSRPLFASEGGGALSGLALAFLATLLLLSPISMACYAFDAPLWVFSAGLAAVCGLGALELARTRADRALWAALRRESLVPWLLLGALLWLQARVGAYFEGDATFHLGRVRVLLEHGFTNRDIYLADEHFQSIYHTNLLYPLYASLAQLSGESYLAVWFHSQPWAKLLVAAAHFVFGHALTRRPLAGWALALTVIAANAGETYTVYPNSLAVGYLLPLMLAGGFSLLGRGDVRGATSLLAASVFVSAQVHALYALYAGLALGPALALFALGSAVVRAIAAKRGGAGSRLSSASPVRIALGLACLFIAAPFLIVSRYGTPAVIAARLWPEPPPRAAPEAGASTPQSPASASARPSPPPITKPVPDNRKGRPVVPTPAVQLGGGHLEKWLEHDSKSNLFRFMPEHMGGRGFIAFGLVAFALAGLLNREQRAPIAGAAFAALGLSVALFSPHAATYLLNYLDQPFTVARLSTVLSTLLLFGFAAALAESCALAGGRLFPDATGGACESRPRWRQPRRIGAALVLALAVAAATRLTGHAPLFFSELAQLALAPSERRHAQLAQLQQRRALLQRVIPRGTTVLTTARFARFVVMLCDCYVIAADRGHTGVPFIRERREQLQRLNGRDTPWPERAALLQRYDLELVVFESRHLRRLYGWTREHGRVIGEAAGLEVVRLDVP